MITIHTASGNKGGVGKTAHALNTINFLSKNHKVVVIETDTQIPDVARICDDESTTKREIALYHADLRTDEGWQMMIETLQNIASTTEDSDNLHIVMSLPGADIDEKKYIELFGSVLDALNIELWDWFVINEQADSIRLLKASIKRGFSSIATKKLVVKNGRFGEPESFVLYDSDEVAQQVDHVCYMHKLTPGAATRLRSETCTIDEVSENAKKGIGLPKPDILYSANLSAWVRKNNEEFVKIFGEAV